MNMDFILVGSRTITTDSIESAMRSRLGRLEVDRILKTAGSEMHLRISHSLKISFQVFSKFSDLGLTVSAHGDRIADTNCIEDQADKVLFFTSILHMLRQFKLSRQG